jgi:hypothetical protein
MPVGAEGKVERRVKGAARRIIALWIASDIGWALTLIFTVRRVRPMTRDAELTKW